MRRLLLLLVCVPVLLVAACGSSGGSKNSSDKASTVAGTGALKGVQVSDGTTPKITVSDAPVSVKKTTVQVIDKGKGPVVRKDQNVTINYLLVNGRDGKQADSTYGGRKQTFMADPDVVLPGIADGLLGQKVGSRVLVAVPPSDGFGSQGNSQLGIGANDSMLFVMDLAGAHTPLPHAEGAPVTPKPGLPTVSSGTGKPTITVPKSAPPKKLVVQPLIRGTHEKVKAGQTITAQYTGELWRNGKVFDSTWAGSNKPASFTVGAGQVIPGWDKGLVGQKVGSRILLVIPPKDGYPNGSPDGTIKKTDTLVFVVDILDTN